MDIYESPKRNEASCSHINSVDNDEIIIVSDSTTVPIRDFRVDVEEPRTPTLDDFAISSTAMEAIERMSMSVV